MYIMIILRHICTFQLSVLMVQFDCVLCLSSNIYLFHLNFIICWPTVIKKNQLILFVKYFYCQFDIT